MLVDGWAAAAGRDHEHTPADQRLDDGQLANGERRWTAYDSPESAISVGLHDVAFRFELLRTFRGQLAADELRRPPERRVHRVDLHLRNDGRDGARAVRLA